jgi:hypothetical protein
MSTFRQGSLDGPLVFDRPQGAKGSVEIANELSHPPAPGRATGRATGRRPSTAMTAFGV